MAAVVAMALVGTLWFKRHVIGLSGKKELRGQAWPLSLSVDLDLLNVLVHDIILMMDFK